MADINANLKTALNGIPAQHKDANSVGFEVTEGSDGQLHVRDQDAKVGLENIKAELTNVLNAIQGQLDVTDSDALTVLQEISTKIDSISGSQDLRGLSTDKPDAATVAPGTTYWSVDTDPGMESIEYSDGTAWAVLP